MLPLRSRAVQALVCCFALSALAIAQGTVSGSSRIPGGAVPATPVWQGKTPIPSIPFTITQSGSYFLSQDLTGVAGQNGIVIQADNVDLDLNGFTLFGVPGSLDGIWTVSGFARSLHVHGGTLRDWGGDGIDARYCSASLFHDLRTQSVGGDGIRIGSRSTLRDCVTDGSGNDGIEADDCVTLTNCSTSSSGSNGIVVRYGNTILGCSTRDSGNVGIFGSLGTTVKNCSVNASQAVGIRVNGAGVIESNVLDCDDVGTGILASTGGLVRNNSVYDAGVDGIQGSSNATFVGNQVWGAAGSGIRVTLYGNRVEGNTVQSCAIGFEISGPGNMVSGNVARGNATEYSILAGNAAGPIVTPATIAANTNPAANYDL